MTLFLSRIPDGDAGADKAEPERTQRDEENIAQGEEAEKNIESTPKPEGVVYEAPTIDRCLPTPTSMREDTSRAK